MTDNLRETSGWIRKYLFSNPHAFVLEDLCWNLATKVLEDWLFVLEDMWVNPTLLVLESDLFCAWRFVLESARKSSRILSIRAWRFVAESEHVGGGILGHSWQNLKCLNPIRAWIRICSSEHTPKLACWLSPSLLYENMTTNEIYHFSDTPKYHIKYQIKLVILHKISPHIKAWPKKNPCHFLNPMTSPFSMLKSPWSHGHSVVISL